VSGVQHTSPSMPQRHQKTPVSSTGGICPS